MASFLHRTFPRGPEHYSAANLATERHVTEEQRQVLVAKRAPQRLDEWRGLAPEEAYVALLQFRQTQQRSNGILPELRAYIDFKGAPSPEVKALLRTLAECAKRQAHTGRVIDFFAKHPFLGTAQGPQRWARVMTQHGLVKAELPRHYRDPELVVSEDHADLGRYLQAWATKEGTRLRTLPGLEGDDELARNLRAALVWDLVGTTATELDSAVADFLYFSEGDHDRDPDADAAANHGRRAIGLYYIIRIRGQFAFNLEDADDDTSGYVFGNLCMNTLERVLRDTHWPKTCDWLNVEARKATYRAQEEAFSEYVKGTTAEPKLYKKHAHYGTLREYVAGWFASTRMRQTVFSHWETALFLPESKRFKVAHQDFAQRAAQ